MSSLAVCAGSGGQNRNGGPAHEGQLRPCVLEKFFERLVPEDTPYFEHTAEGRDDNASHIRSVLTRSSEVIPIADGRIQLGTWQGIFLSSIDARRINARSRSALSEVRPLA